ncbi:MAG: biotin/lipoyl-containing protein, partial [Microbacterium sp.]
FEARVYAEDAASGFLPTGGHVIGVRHPHGAGIRVDTALEDGLDVSVDYDPMLAKIITWGTDRDQARRRLVAALDDTAVFGFTTNVEFLRLLLEVPDVVSGALDTGLIARELDGIAFAQADDRAFAEAALILDAAAVRDESPWYRRDGWRLTGSAPRRYPLRAAVQAQTVSLVGTGENTALRTDDGDRRAHVRFFDDGLVSVDLDGEVRTFPARAHDNGVSLVRDGALLRFEQAPVLHVADAVGDTDPELVSPMPGTVVATRVADGDTVVAGDAIVVVEAMKMEHVVRCTVAGVVALRAHAGEVVSRDQTLAIVTPQA